VFLSKPEFFQPKNIFLHKNIIIKTQKSLKMASNHVKIATGRHEHFLRYLELYLLVFGAFLIF